MKTIQTSIFKLSLIGALFVICFISACKKDNIITLKTPVALMGPAKDSTITLDIDTDRILTFEWSSLPVAGSNIKYMIMFDKSGTLFTSPVAVFSSDNNGLDTKLTIHHTSLDSIAEIAGIPKKKTGTLEWAVEAIQDKDTITSVARSFIVKRPTSLGTVPQFIYLVGSATEVGTNPADAIVFHKSGPGEFDLFTTLKPGTFKILNSNSTDAKAYLIVDGQLYRGDQEMTVSSSVKPYFITVSFNSAEGMLAEVQEFDILLAANATTLGILSYDAPNHKFISNSFTFHFLKPGDPGAPTWLSWVEERYRFNLITNLGNFYYGSYHDASMYGVYIPGMTPYPFRPDGQQPAGYFNVYKIPPTITNYIDWAGCYKMGDAFDGSSIIVTINVDPTQTAYTHTVVKAK